VVPYWFPFLMMLSQRNVQKSNVTGIAGLEDNVNSNTDSTSQNSNWAISSLDSTSIVDKTSNDRSTIALVHRTKISEEITCSVCLDIFFRPITLVPCGHTLCQPAGTLQRERIALNVESL
jgi:hypothetical protein